MSPQYIHAKIHTIAIGILLQNHSEFEWLTDYDYYYDERSKVQPDVSGFKHGRPQVFVEISDSTMGRDSQGKFALYQALGIPYYIMINCQDYQVLRYELRNDSYVPTEEFSALNSSIFNFAR